MCRCVYVRTGGADKIEETRAAGPVGLDLGLGLQRLRRRILCLPPPSMGEVARAARRRGLPLKSLPPLSGIGHGRSCGKCTPLPALRDFPRRGQQVSWLPLRGSWRRRRRRGCICGFAAGSCSYLPHLWGRWRRRRRRGLSLKSLPPFPSIHQLQAEPPLYLCNTVTVIYQKDLSTHRSCDDSYR